MAWHDIPDAFGCLEFRGHVVVLLIEVTLHLFASRVHRGVCIYQPFLVMPPNLYPDIA
jgi:hypothetical protein